MADRGAKMAEPNVADQAKMADRAKMADGKAKMAEPDVADRAKMAD